MTALRVLMAAHNHPAFHPGGSEIFAHDLFAQLRGEADVEALFLGCVDQTYRKVLPGTMFQAVGDAADELVLWSGHFDRFFQSQRDLAGVVPDLERLLSSFRPDIVHFHHSELLGVEALFLVKRVLPHCRLVYTLHDYYPICPRDGIMVRPDGELCSAPGIDSCRTCFPEVRADHLLLREKHIKALFSLVDRFVAPSEFLRRRFVAWGLPAERLVLMRNGRPAAGRTQVHYIPAAGPRRRLGFFGNISPAKGTLLALDAVNALIDGGADLNFRIHGAPLFQDESFRARFESALGRHPDRVSWHGPYRRDEMTALLSQVDWVVVPSMWWENAPLVIQEAFQAGRPVICSNIGGLAEMVRDGVDGLHFAMGDVESLKTVLRRALAEAGTWQRLAANIAPVRSIAEAAAEHKALYRRLIDAATA